MASEVLFLVKALFEQKLCSPFALKWPALTAREQPFTVPRLERLKTIHLQVTRFPELYSLARSSSATIRCLNVACCMLKVE